MVLTGVLHAREFDRVEALGPDTMRLRLLFDGEMGPGDIIQARDGARNAHWFAALDAPATLLNFNIRGYESETFWPLETRPLGRRLLDATQADGDGLFAGLYDGAFFATGAQFAFAVLTHDLGGLLLRFGPGPRSVRADGGKCCGHGAANCR